MTLSGDFSLSAPTFLTVALVLIIVATGCVTPFVSEQTTPSQSGRQSTQTPHSQQTPTSDRTTYQAIVIFRNDDVQPYYRTEALEEVSTVFLEEDVPLTHGVIPYTGSTPITEARGSVSI